PASLSRSARRSPPAPRRGGRHAPRAARRGACGLRTAPPAERRSAAAVCRASVGRDEQRDVVVALLELDFDSDAAEEGRLRPEQQPVDTRLEIRSELGDAPVRIGLGRAQEVVARALHAGAPRWAPVLSAQNVSREGYR